MTKALSIHYGVSVWAMKTWLDIKLLLVSAHGVIISMIMAVYLWNSQLIQETPSSLVGYKIKLSSLKITHSHTIHTTGVLIHNGLKLMKA
jgi:hypothetical protein